MLAYALYILKVIVCSGILFGYYWLMLRNKIFHHYNRFYLLAAVVLSLALPLIRIDIWHNADKPAAGAIKLLQAVNSSDEYLDEIVLTAQQNSFSAEQALSYIYLLTSLLFFGAFVFALIKIRLLFTRHRHRLLGNIIFVNTTEKGTPFSFMKCIFWNDHIDPESNTGKQVFRHELAHVQQLHSYDKLFLNAILVITWCNPFFWLIRKELNMIHEFVADKIAVQDNDTEAFAAMILQAAYPQHRFQLSNPFFYSPIKRRLMMLTKNRNPKVGYIGRLLVLPLAIVVFAAFTLKSKSLKEKFTSYDGDPITVVIDAGHGGQDGGARGLNAVMEKDLTLAISKKISLLNTNKKINIVLPRTSDVYQTPDAKARFGKQHNADLFISVHLNPLKSGLEVIVADKPNSNQPISTLLASALINEFSQGFKLAVSQHPRQAQQSIKVLNAAECPAVLIEAGNIADEKDLAYLNNGGIDAIAEKVLHAVEKFAGSLKRTNAQPETAVVQLLKSANEPKVDTVPEVVVKSADNALIIVDGKIVSQAELKKVSPELITNVNVLKGQAALNKYGTKGKDGVVVVTTKNREITLNDLNVTIQTDSTKIEKIRLDNVRISTNASLSPLNQPLYFVDGVELQEKTLMETVDPNDIAELTIIKDKIAIEKYGSRAINGVVEVHTKNKVKLSVTERKPNVHLDEVVVVGNGSKQQGQPMPGEAIFTRAENEPTFPGGDSAWKRYLIKNAKAEMPVVEGWKSGVYKIIVSFIVRKDGTVADVKTSDFPGSLTAEHCIDLIRNGPKWKPALQKGQPVNAYKKQPITFVVEDQNSL